MKSIPILFVFVLLIGCATKISLPEPNTPSIELKKAQTVGYWIADTVTFPAGVYRPDFKTDAGIYYASPQRLIIKNPILGESPRTGGIFLSKKVETKKSKVYMSILDHLSGINTGS